MSAQSACMLMNPGVKTDLKLNLCNVEPFRSLQEETSDSGPLVSTFLQHSECISDAVNDWFQRKRC